LNLESAICNSKGEALGLVPTRRGPGPEWGSVAGPGDYRVFSNPGGRSSTSSGSSAVMRVTGLCESVRNRENKNSSRQGAESQRAQKAQGKRDHLRFANPCAFAPWREIAHFFPASRTFVLPAAGGPFTVAHCERHHRGAGMLVFPPPLMNVKSVRERGHTPQIFFLTIAGEKISRQGAESQRAQRRQETSPSRVFAPSRLGERFLIFSQLLVPPSRRCSLQCRSP